MDFSSKGEGTSPKFFRLGKYKKSVRCSPDSPSPILEGAGLAHKGLWCGFNKFSGVFLDCGPNFSVLFSLFGSSKNPQMFQYTCVSQCPGELPRKCPLSVLLTFFFFERLRESGLTSKPFRVLAQSASREWKADVAVPGGQHV